MKTNGYRLVLCDSSVCAEKRGTKWRKCHWGHLLALAPWEYLVGFCWDVDLLTRIWEGVKMKSIQSLSLTGEFPGNQAVPMSLPKMSPIPGVPCSFFFVSFPPIGPPLPERFLLPSRYVQPPASNLTLKKKSSLVGNKIMRGNFHLWIS